jgi:hypothetical protein
VTEVQRSRKVVNVKAGEARFHARRRNRTHRAQVRQALRRGDLDAIPHRPRTIAWDLS